MRKATLVAGRGAVLVRTAEEEECSSLQRAQSIRSPEQRVQCAVVVGAEFRNGIEGGIPPIALQRVWMFLTTKELQSTLFRSVELAENEGVAEVVCSKRGAYSTE
jgi:hypothetical protein